MARRGFAKRIALIFTALTLALMAAFAFFACDASFTSGQPTKSTSAATESISSLTAEDAAEKAGEEKENQISEENMMKFTETDQVTDYVRITMENGHTIVIRLLPQYVPVTVANFQTLVSEHFYDGIIFHRVIAGFMIQGGDPTGTGFGGSGETIPAEFVFEVDGQKTIIPHKRGVVSMARSGDPNSASSQFFICHADAPHLNGSYAAFGCVVDGMSTVDEIAAVATDENDKPLVEQRMKTVTFVIPEKA